MTPTLASTIATLDELHAKTTRAEWTASGTSIVTEQYCIAVIEDDGGYEAPGEQRKANQEFIVALHNAWPEIRKALDEKGANRATD